VSTSISVNEYFQRYQLLNPRMRSAKSIEAMSIDIKILNEFFHEVQPDAHRNVELGDLSAELISGAAGWLVKKGRQPATANRFIRHIAALWRFAAQDDSVHHIIKPLTKLRKHKEPKRVPEAWSPDQFEKMVAVASTLEGKVGEVPASIFWPCLLLVCYWTGGRVSALMALKVADVDFEGCTIKFVAETQKHYADEVFHIPQDVVDLIKQLDPASRGHTLLFGDWPLDRSGVWGWKYLNREFGKIAKAAGLATGRRYKWHMVRRTIATQVCGVLGKSAAQAFLGHSSASTTERYLDPRLIKRVNPVDLIQKIHVPSQLKIVG
jgi:integrase